MHIPKRGSCGIAEGDRVKDGVKDGVCNAVFVRWITQMSLCEHSRTLEYLCFQFIWEQA